jgi:hypothetical protein
MHIPPLVDPKEIKTELLKQLDSKEFHTCRIVYDEESWLSIYFTKQKGSLIVHFIDDHTAVYLDDKNEVVGIYIENLQSLIERS